MDFVLVSFGAILIILGLIGAFLPVLPGPITSWFGLLLLHLTDAVPLNKHFLLVTLIVAIAVWLIDYFLPALGTRKFGGSKYGVWGAIIGLFLGLIILGPLGIILGPFLGALIAEISWGKKNKSQALKAAFGSFIGFLFSTGLKLIVSLIYAGFFISQIARNWKYFF